MFVSEWTFAKMTAVHGQTRATTTISLSGALSPSTGRRRDRR